MGIVSFVIQPTVSKAVQSSDSSAVPSTTTVHVTVSASNSDMNSTQHPDDVAHHSQSAVLTGIILGAILGVLSISAVTSAILLYCHRRHPRLAGDLEKAGGSIIYTYESTEEEKSEK